MPALFVFLLKVNIALVVFCLGYYLVLRRLTFYTLNRAYLGVAIIFSTLYPLVNLDGFVQRHQQLTPVQNVIISLKAPAQRIVNPIIEQPNYWYWAEALFWAGATLFALRLLLQLASLYKLYKNSKPGKIQEQDVRIINADISPFSFWQSIYINPENLNTGDLQSILQHEQVHVKEWHTLDILLAEISVIFYWFNPGVWLMKKAVRENIEFITDRKILQKGMDSKTYQYSLLNVSFAPTTSAGITNHFNFSTLKKRIVMMNAKRSSNVNLTRYAFLVPAVVVLLLVFSFSKAELVKNGKVAYKTIEASVSNLTLPTTANHQRGTANKKTTDKALDTGKKLLTYFFKQGTDIDTKSFTSSYKFFPKTDTGKKSFTFSYSLGKDSDTKAHTNFFYLKKDTIIDDNTKKLTRDIVITKRIKNGVRDSVTVIINGKKVDPADVDKLSAEDIESVNMKRDDGAGSLVLVTKNKNVTITGKDGHQTVTLNETTPGDIIRKTNRANDSSKIKELLGKMQGMVVTSDGNLTHNGQTVAKIRVNGKPIMVKDFVLNLDEVKRDADKPTLFTGKLILVDGKESTESGKIPADKVKSIKMKTATTDDITKYGDKAKNGIIVITTKKGKK